MNIYVYSTNVEITKRFLEILSAPENSVHSFSSIESITKALAQESLVNLIYHLGQDEHAESELESIQTAFREKINTLVVTNTPEPEQGVRLLNLNVRGYVNTFIEQDKLIMALSVIEQGEIWAGAALIQYMLTKSINQNKSDQALEQETSVFKLLSDREQQIAQKVLLGLQNKHIGDELFITERTVKAHLSTIFKKLKVRNRLEMTLKLQQADRRALI